MESTIEYIDGRYIHTDPENFGLEVYALPVDDILTSKNGNFSVNANYFLKSRNFIYYIDNNSHYKSLGSYIEIDPANRHANDARTASIKVSSFKMQGSDELYDFASCLVELADLLDELRDYIDSGKIFENEEVLNDPVFQKFLNAE